MPYCHNCGTKTEDHAKHCSECGVKVSKKNLEEENRGIPEAVGGFIGMIIGIILILGLIFAGIWGFSLLMDSSISIPVIKEPRFVVVSQSGNDGMDGLNYVDYVTCYIRNEGNGGGTALVTAQLYGGGSGNKVLTKNIYLPSSQSQEVKFTFDTSFLSSLFSSGGKYRCSVRKI